MILAGWLRRGRAPLARGTGRPPPACPRTPRGAPARPGGDASAWIENAVSLYRRLRLIALARQAALSRAMVALPDDPARWIDLGRLLGHVGWSEESQAARAKGRSLLERRLSGAPDDEAAAAALAELLPEAEASVGWIVLRPDAMTSAAGTTLTRLPDDSVLAGGLNPAVDTYTVEAMTGLSGITGLQLEAIPDPSLPRHGPGRDKGNFHLDSIRLCTVSGHSAPVPARLRRACADYSEPMYAPKGVSGSLDTDPTTAWSIWPLVGRPHWAVFQTDAPIGSGAGTRLRVELASAGFARTTWPVPPVGDEPSVPAV